jgi:hypothetical protein
MPAAAEATPRTPGLIGTHPSSPGLSTTPRVFGSAGEVVTTGIGGQARGEGTGAFTSLEGEEGTIAIYGNSACSGLPLIEGPAAELESPGIPVPVAAGSTTTFFATQADLTGTSACSNGVPYRQVSDPPGPASVSGVNPAVPADDNLPFVLGSADPESTVTIFTNPSCSGSPVGTGAAETFSAQGIQVSVPDNSTTTFYALASWADLPSTCSSSSATYQEVTAAAPGQPPVAEPPSSGAPAPAPGVGPAKPVAPKIHTVPGHRSNDASPLVAGSSPGAVRVDLFRNAVCDGGPAASVTPAELSGGVQLQVAENAVTSFFARATDAAGNSSGCSEEAVYVEDSTPPVTRITFGPGVKTRRRAPVFRFIDLTDDPPGTSFVCKLDRRAWRPCSAPWKLSHLKPKSHLALVRAIDAAGNEEAVPAKRRFRVVAR